MKAYHYILFISYADVYGFVFTVCLCMCISINVINKTVSFHCVIFKI